MRSKWEWIRDACKELGYEEAAGIADEIEKVLKEIYGDTKTCRWMKDYIDVKYGGFDALDADSLWFTANSIRYCIACVEDVHCDTCRFAERTGGCLGDDALYRRFIFALKKEANQK